MSIEDLRQVAADKKRRDIQLREAEQLRQRQSDERFAQRTAEHREIIGQQVAILNQHGVVDLLKRAAREAGIEPAIPALSGKFYRGIAAPEPYESNVGPVAAVQVWDYEWTGHEGCRPPYEITFKKEARAVGCSVVLDHQNRPVGLAVSGIERPVPFPADNTPPSLAKFRKQLEEKVTQAMTKAIEGQPYNYSEEYFPRRAPSHPLEKIPPQILGPKR